MPNTPEYTEVVAGSPELLFDAVKDGANWVPKMAPDVYQHVEHEDVDDDDGPGAFELDVHDGKQHLHGGNTKFNIVVEDWDPERLSYVVNFQDTYPEYRQLKYHIMMLPGPSSNTTSIKWHIEYHPWDERTGAPDHLVDFNVMRLLFKDLAAHLQAQGAY